MCYKLENPISKQEKIEFLVKYNDEMNLNIVNTEMFLFALEQNEIMGEKEIEIDVPDYEDVEIETEDEEGNIIKTVETRPITNGIEEIVQVPTFRDVEVEIQVIQYDEEGNILLGEDGEPIYSTVVEVKREPVLDEGGNQIYHDETIIRQVPVTHKETIIVPYPVINPNYDEEQKEKRKEEFNKDFFNTSLGYIRRKVTMANGETKDFLSDLLPTISMGVQFGQEVKIIAYNEPDFTQKIIDWEALQHNEVVTTEFIQECFLQLSKDFGTVQAEEQ